MYMYMNRPVLHACMRMCVMMVCTPVSQPALRLLAFVGKAYPWGVTPTGGAIWSGLVHRYLSLSAPLNLPRHAAAGVPNGHRCSMPHARKDLIVAACAVSRVGYAPGFLSGSVLGWYQNRSRHCGQHAPSSSPPPPSPPLTKALTAHVRSSSPYRA